VVTATFFAAAAHRPWAGALECLGEGLPKQTSKIAPYVPSASGLATTAQSRFQAAWRRVDLKKLKPGDSTRGIHTIASGLGTQPDSTGIQYLFFDGIGNLFFGAKLWARPSS
jgi:hypothetical protein